MPSCGSRGLALALAAAAPLALGCDRLAALGRAGLTSPETQIREALARQDRARLADLAGEGAGGTAELGPVRFAEPAIAAEGGRAVVAAVLDAEGRVAWRDQVAHLRYRGRERFHMRPCGTGGWCAEEDQLARLGGVLAALLRRHGAEAAGDPAALAPLVSAAYADRGEGREALLARLAREWGAAPAPPAVRAWQVRVDREAAEVGEDLARAGPGGGAEAARRVYRLALEGGRWVFVGGL